MTDWGVLAVAAAQAARTYARAARDRVFETISVQGKVNSSLADREQRLVHGFAWIATTAEAPGATAQWAARSTSAGAFGEVEELVLRIGFGEYLDPLNMVREEFRKFARERIAPSAHAWHLADTLIPDDVVREMADLGVFGVCIDERYGGLGLGKLAMCLVSEELSRGWICRGLAAASD